MSVSPAFAARHVQQSLTSKQTDSDEFARAGDLERVVLFYVPAGTWCLFLA